MAEKAIILLAAGSSSRMGSPKQLLGFGGKPMLRHAVDVALGTTCDVVVVVLGANADTVRAVLDGVDAGRLLVVENARWAEGMGTSIQTGLVALAGRDIEGAILALADQPLVTTEILERLIDDHERTGKPIVASSYAGTVGVPVWFSKSHFSQLMALDPDKGCKGVIVRNAGDAFLIDCPEGNTDVDTPADYAAIQFGE